MIRSEIATEVMAQFSRFILRGQLSVGDAAKLACDYADALIEELRRRSAADTAKAIEGEQ